MSAHMHNVVVVSVVGEKQAALRRFCHNGSSFWLYFTRRRRVKYIERCFEWT